MKHTITHSLITGFALAVSATGAVITDGLVAEYTFNTSTPVNTGPLGSDGFNVGSPVYQVVDGRQALTVSEGNYVEVPTDTDVYSENDPRTVALWVNVGTFNEDTSPFRSGQAGTSGRDFSIELEPDGEWTLNRWNTDFLDNALGGTNEWRHLAVTFTGSTPTEDNILTTYLDGVFLQSRDRIQFFTTEGPLRFGGHRIRPGRTQAPNADLSVDDILIYNRALSASEIAQIAVPEPSSGVLALIAACALSFRRRR